MSKAKKIVMQYMDESEFEENLERAANDRPVKWAKTPSIEACNRWKNICRRRGIKI